VGAERVEFTKAIDPRPPVLEPGHNYATITDKIGAIVLEDKIRPGWVFGLLIALTLVFILHIAIVLLMSIGVGIWGINIPIGWGFAIVNFVWWIGIGHAGTLISAFLLLMRQAWRQSINRFAEAMTLFAVACAGMFPLLHMGRPWLFFYLMPYPDTMGTWPQFRSPLVWDVFAVSTYGTISLLFWFVGLIPDLAALRDKAKHKIARLVYGGLSMGWRGSAIHWHRYEMAYLLLAGIATPLVLSVHTVVSFDFTLGVIPGWHSTIFPPYFVAGAIYSGFAMVLTLAIPLRKFYHLEDVLTIRHIDNMGKILLATGCIVAYGYFMETFMAFYGGPTYDHYMMKNRMTGPYAPMYWMLILCNIAIPLTSLWFAKVRRNVGLMFMLSLVVQTGMWLERFVIVITSLHRDFVPSSWGMYYPTIWDWAVFLGTIGLFFTLFLLFIRALPMISIFEMRGLVHELKEKVGYK
jgi:Ni/Fe-hydrogenase subunit HybB-like protein